MYARERRLQLLEMQGWTGADLQQADEAGLWVRWSPALCLTTLIVGTALESPALLLVLAATAAVGASSASHVFDVAYNRGFRHLLRLPAIPPARAARRSACALASVWLVATALAFLADATLLAHALGWSLAAAAATFTFAGFCVPSFLFNTFLGRERACRPTLSDALRKVPKPEVRS